MTSSFFATSNPGYSPMRTISCRKATSKQGNMKAQPGVVVFAGTAAAGLLGVGFSSMNAGDVSSTVVTKSVISDKFRLVFIAGLEGTGHHYVMGADNAMFKMNPDLPRISKNYELSQQPYYVPSFMGGNGSQYAEAESRAREEMKRLAEQADGLPLPGTTYLMHNSWSYPTNSGWNKVMQYLDLQRLVEEAEVNGVDMRVLYLRRSAKDIVIANTVHRHFQK